MKNKRSFFERLTGSINLNNEDYEEEKNAPPVHGGGNFSYKTATAGGFNDFQPETASVFKTNKKSENEEEGQLTVDCFKNKDGFTVQAFLAGLKPDDLDISITRDMITIKGKRVKQISASSEDYITQELYWGSFSRSIILPEEIDVDASEAALKNSILTITLPKLDKNRSQKIKVKND